MDDILEIAIPETNSLNIDQLREKISLLEKTEDGEPLKNAMDDLKVALKQNPAACSLMLDEDIGKCVAQLRRLTNKNILADLEPKKKDSLTKVKVTKEDIDNLTLKDLM